MQPRDEPNDDDPGPGYAVWILPVLGILTVVGFLLFTIYGR